MNAKLQAFHMCCPITVAGLVRLTADTSPQWIYQLQLLHVVQSSPTAPWCRRGQVVKCSVSLLVLCFTSSVADRTWKMPGLCLVQCFVWNKKHVRSSQFGVCSITFSRVTFRVTFIIATWCNSCISCISTQESHNKSLLEGKLNEYDNVHLHFLHKLFSDEKFFWALRMNLFWLVSNVVHFSGKFRIKLSWTWRYSDKMFQDTQILGKPHCSSAILITHILTQP